MFQFEMALFFGEMPNKFESVSLRKNVFFWDIQIEFLTPSEKTLRGPGPDFFIISTFKVIFIYFKRVFRLFWH